MSFLFGGGDDAAPKANGAETVGPTEERVRGAKTTDEALERSKGARCSGTGVFRGCVCCVCMCVCMCVWSVSAWLKKSKLRSQPLKECERDESDGISEVIIDTYEVKHAHTHKTHIERGYR